MKKDLRAPTDAREKRPGFYLLKNLAIQSTTYSDGGRRDEIYLDSGRIESAARLNGNITDEAVRHMLSTTGEFKKLIHSIGISISGTDPQSLFTFSMIHYGHTDPYRSGTHCTITLPGNGVEQVFDLDSVEWSADDEKTGQFAVGFPEDADFAVLNVRIYVREGYDIPEEEPEAEVDFETPAYKTMIERSLVQVGNSDRLIHAIAKARAREEVTVAYIGGSITQGAGAVPINSECYAWQSFCRFRDAFAADPTRLRYVKAGIGGTSSELGVVRYDEQVTEYGTVSPDIVIVEFAVNDAGDETEGHCYEGLVRKIWNGPGNPAVILLFSVFADDYTLQDRFIPYGKLADLPMISLKNALVDQFNLTPETGRLVSRSQYFYDSYHPSNLGHRIMADCLMHYFETAAATIGSADAAVTGTNAVSGSAVQNGPADLPVYWSADFENVQFFDRRTLEQVVQNASAGSFTGTDTEIQAVQRNFDRELTPMFPYNWMYAGAGICTGATDGTECEGSTAGATGEPHPFEFDITCRLLMIVQKDSGSGDAGTAEVFIDGEKVRTLNPREIGWTHSNALILLRNKDSALHHVQIVPDAGKNFTILGFASC